MAVKYQLICLNFEFRFNLVSFKIILELELNFNNYIKIDFTKYNYNFNI